MSIKHSWTASSKSTWPAPNTPRQTLRTDGAMASRKVRMAAGACVRAANARAVRSDELASDE